MGKTKVRKKWERLCCEDCGLSWVGKLTNRDLGKKQFSFGKSCGVGEAPMTSSREKSSPLRATFSVTSWWVTWPWSSGRRLFAAGLWVAVQEHEAGPAPLVPEDRGGQRGRPGSAPPDRSQTKSHRHKLGHEI